MRYVSCALEAAILTVSPNMAADAIINIAIDGGTGDLDIAALTREIVVKIRCDARIPPRLLNGTN